MKTPQLFPQNCPETFPVKASRGSAAAAIYRFWDTKNGLTYPVFKIPDSEGGLRKSHRFAAYEDARARGNEMLDKFDQRQRGRHYLDQTGAGVIPERD